MALLHTLLNILINKLYQNLNAMKKKFLKTTISFLLIALASKAQSILVKNKSGDVVNNDTLIVFAEPLQKPPLIQIQCKLYPQNKSDQPIDLLVKKTEYILGANVEHSFCFGVYCYAPSVFVSPSSSLVDGIESSFKGVYIYNPALHTPRKDLVSYTFYNKNDIKDSAIVYVEYNTINGLGLETFGNADQSVVQVYPNPSYTTVNISANEQIQKIDLFDLMGKKIKAVSVMKNTYAFDVQELICGQYMFKVYFKDCVRLARFCKG